MDAEADTVEAFLQFLYEFKLPSLNLELATNLMLMGDKYNVPSLVSGCRDYFADVSKNLREDDLVQVAIIGYLLKEGGLKEASISKMGKLNGPLSDLKGWKELEAHPALALEIADMVARMKQREVENVKHQLIDLKVQKDVLEVQHQRRVRQYTEGARGTRSKIALEIADRVARMKQREVRFTSDQLIAHSPDQLIEAARRFREEVFRGGN